MKKLALIIVAAVALVLSSCQGSQQTRLFINPTSINIKVGQTYSGITYGVEGEGIDISDIVKAIQDDDNCFTWTGGTNLTGDKAGHGKIGVVVYNEKGKPESGFKYQAWCNVNISN